MNQWNEVNNSLQKTYVFKNFIQAMNFMHAASIKINKLDHHPEWCNVYNKVSITLRTHSAGNIITDKDRELANILDEVNSLIAV